MSDLEVLAGVLDELIKAGINLSALRGDDASKLGTVFGRQLRAAELRGYERAIEVLRDTDRFVQWAFKTRPEAGVINEVCVAYLESVAPSQAKGGGDGEDQ